MSPSLNILINKYKNKKNGLISNIRYSPDLSNEIINLTSFLDNDSTISCRVYCILNHILIKPICNCGKQLKFNKINRGFFKTCGDKNCIHNFRSIIAIESNKKINWEKSIQKQKNTKTKKYGVPSNFSKNSKTRESYKQIMKQKYGVEYALQNKNILNKQQETTIKNYGTLNMFNLDKVKNSIFEKYGVEYAMKNKNIAYKSKINSENTKFDKILKKIENMNCEYISHNIFGFTLLCKKCNTEIKNISRHLINFNFNKNESPCHKCFPNTHYRSNFEKDVVNEIQKFYFKEIQFNRKYLGTEIDIIIPDKKIAIECNGIYWHSELYKNKQYHKNKKIFIENKGYNLIQIWEDDWNNVIKKNIILNRIKIKIGLGIKIYARKCELKYVNGKETREFLNTYHLQKYVTSSINLGLYYNKELIFICTFGKTRKPIIGNKKGYELLRNCSKDNYIILGGFSKLIKFFINTYSNILYSYADCDWVSSINSSYEKIGFIKEKYTDPGYWWQVNGIKENRLNFTKQKLIKAGFDKNLSEIEIMHNNGFYRIWNSGNIKYKWNDFKNT